MENKTCLHTAVIPTPIGDMLCAVTDSGVCLLEFVADTIVPSFLPSIEKELQTTAVKTEHIYLTQVQAQLQAYFAGSRKTFTVPIQLIGTDFQKKVWQYLQTIPYGSTNTYLQQANAMQNAAAIRAIASANGKNNIYILIPCHRVMGAGGKLTGFGGGLQRKQYLLHLEIEHTIIKNTLF